MQWTAYEQLTDAQAYEKYVLKRRDSKAITASLKEAAPMLQVTQADLDADPFALNAPGGTIDLTTGEIHEHDYGDFITKQTTTDPATKGMDTWLAALEVFFQGDQRTNRLCAANRGADRDRQSLRRSPHHRLRRRQEWQIDVLEHNRSGVRHLCG